MGRCKSEAFLWAWWSFFCFCPELFVRAFRVCSELFVGFGGGISCLAFFPKTPLPTSHFPVILLGPWVRGIAGLGEFLGLVSCGVEKNTILYKRHQSLVALHESAFHEVLIFETIESHRVFWYRTRRFLCNSGCGGRIDDGKIGISGRTKFCPDDGM